nr:MAG TPA: hypothetical protein [Caudoviricetes sp.]
MISLQLLAILAAGGILPALYLLVVFARYRLYRWAGGALPWRLYVREW